MSVNIVIADNADKFECRLGLLYYEQYPVYNVISLDCSHKYIRLVGRDGKQQ